MCPIGLLIMGILTDIFGRRKTVQIICVPMGIGWLLITFASSYTTLLIGKIILGIPFGKFNNMLFLKCIIDNHVISYFKTVRLQHFQYYKTYVFSNIGFYGFDHRQFIRKFLHITKNIFFVINNY